MNKIKVVVIDDHKMIREMWAKLIATRSDLLFAGESGHASEAVEMIRNIKPDIALLDITLPPSSGIDILPDIRKFSPGTRVITVSMHSEPIYAKKMIKLGAKAYITKNSSHSEIFKAIDEVMKGNIFLCQELKDLISKKFEEEVETPSIKDLSLREIEIIKMLMNELTSKEIAKMLNISARTVDVHRQNIFRKLKLKNVVSLINYVNKNGL